jgi:hypothetical protein
MDNKLTENFTPEMKLVLRAIHVDRNNQHVDWKSFKSRINWPLVTKLAIQHGVLPLLYKYLKRQKEGIVPQTELVKQKNLYLNNVGLNIMVTQKLLNILKILSTNGFESVPFKGPVIAIQAYGDIGLRAFCDLDILIKSSDFSAIYDLLLSEGYLSLKPRIGKLKSIWKKSRRNFEFQGKKCFFDFHMQVSQGPLFFRLKDKWNMLSTVELNSQEVPCLNNHDTILMLALHGTHHGWNILKFVADLAHLIHSNESEINWDALIRKARGMGCLRMVMIGLLLGQDFCGLQIPPLIQDLIQNDKKIRKLAVYFIGKILEKEKSNLIPVMALPRSLDSLYYQFRYMIYYVFNPTNLDVLALRLPGFMYPVYYVIRPVRLFLNLIRDGVAKIKKKT